MNKIIISFLFFMLMITPLAFSYELPTYDGNAGQTLIIDENGNVDWGYGGNVYLSLDATLDTNDIYIKEFPDKTVDKSYTHLTRDENPEIYFLGGLFFVIGLLIMFFVVPKSRK